MKLFSCVHKKVKKICKLNDNKLQIKENVLELSNINDDKSKQVVYIYYEKFIVEI